MKTSGAHDAGAMRVLGLAVVVSLSLTGAPAAQQKPLTLADIYDPDRRVNFSGTPSGNILWIDDDHFTARPDQEGGEWRRVDARTGVSSPLLTSRDLDAALAQVAGRGAGEARVARSRVLAFNRTFTAALVRIEDDLHELDLGGRRLRRLTNAPGTEDHPSFSPDGRTVAFVRGNNLYAVEVATARERRLTSDGSARILNGRLDWVYEEEVYGRGQNRAYWWSPDSTRIAFLQVNDTPVPAFTVVDHIPYEQTVERWDYPKAGDPNPLVKIGIARVSSGSPLWIDTSKYGGIEHLIVRVGWTPDGTHVVYLTQNRTQTWLDLNLAHARSGATRTLFREESPYWIASDDAALPSWLGDGSFLWLSDRSGWRHLYRYSPQGAEIGAVTRGRWEVRTVHGVDEQGGWVYFSGTERSHIGSDLYRIRLVGTELTRLSSAAGTHAATFNPSLTLYVDTWSDITTPPQTRLHASDGRELRVIHDNRVAVLDEYRLARPEFLQVTTRDGFPMEALLIKPPDFDPSRRYPVYQFIYGGPHAPQVRNAWGGSAYLYHQLLAQHGIIVWICDNRTASGKGSESVWPLHRNFGAIELRDIEDGLSWLKQQPYVDASRIGLHGWSYGGYLTSYALTHSRSFVMGIAGGSVTDWRDYDTIYTERYMGLPGEHAEGYRRSSPRFAAANLHGALLLIHGLLDDNVHVDNTIQFAHELQKAQKPFDLMLYPKSRHAVTDAALVYHMRATMLRFVMEHLKPHAPPTPSRP